MNAVTITRSFNVNPHVTSLIDGKSVAPTGNGEDIPIINPMTEEVTSRLREADAEEVDAAVRSSRRAFDEGPWPRMDITERKDILYSIRDHLRKNAEELAFLECLNTGLPLQSVRVHVQRMARNFEFFAEVASTVHGETYTQTKGYLTYVTREPKGVAAAIAPWNAPLALASMRVATCIPWGNTCVLKPSEYTPLSMLRMVEIFHEAGLPPGVVNIVNGRGAVTGNALVSHPDIDMIGFTGGTVTGRAIAAAAGKNLKPIALELGGKSANIIFESADIERALDGALAGIFANNGQQCLAGSRILVQKSIAKQFVERFVISFYRSLDTIFVPSMFTAKDLLGKGIEERKLRKISRGVPVRDFEHAPVDAGLRARLCGSRDAFLVLYVGRVSREKNLEAALAGFEELRGSVPQAHFLIVGDGPLRAELVARQLEHVHLPGEVVGPALATLYASSDVFLFPSETDTFANAVVEATAAGLPVVTAQGSAAAEHCMHGVNGFVVDMADPGEIAMRLSWLLQNPALRARMAQESRQLSRRYDLTEAAHEQYAQYAQLLRRAEPLTPGGAGKTSAANAGAAAASVAVASVAAVASPVP